MKKEVTLKKILTNGAIIVAIILAVAIAAHFLLRIATRHGVSCAVPELKGLSLSEAQSVAAQNDLKLFINDSLYVPTYPGGAVLDQLPAGGVKVKPGRTIYIVINAFGKRMVDLPYVADRSLRQAKNMLDVAGLEIKRIKYVEDMATNYVLSQSYEGREVSASSPIKVPSGAGVELTVGVSPQDPYTRTPNVIGLSLKEAKSRIWESGLNVGRIDLDKGINLLQDKNAKVYIQAIAANSAAQWGQSMNITLTLDETKTQNAVTEAHKADLEFEKLLLEQQEAEGEEQEMSEEESEVENNTADMTIDEFFQ